MPEQVIVWNSRDPLGGRSQDAFEAEVARLLAGRVRAAYIFGSYGTPEFGRDSDVDLLIVADTGRRFVDRPLDFPELFELVPDLDLLVYTQEEFDRLTSEPSPGFWTSVTANLRRLV